MKENEFSPVTILATARRTNALAVCLIAFCLLFASAVSIAAKTDGQKKATAPAVTCDVENFGKVNDHYYRGAQPEEGQYAQLKALGIKTVLDLRDDPRDFAKPKAEEAGLHYINLPLDDKSYPAEESVKKFLEYANDTANWPIFVHCAGGRHRTGAMTAVYRMTMENWDIAHAYAEMKQYDFYTRWGHKAMKTFVYDYAKDLPARRARLTHAESIAAPNVDN